MCYNWYWYMSNNKMLWAFFIIFNFWNKIKTFNRKNKLVHAIAATAMANCFNEIEIPYSIVIFSDYVVNLLLKNLRSLIQKK